MKPASAGVEDKDAGPRIAFLSNRLFKLATIAVRIRGYVNLREMIPTDYLKSAHGLAHHLNCAPNVPMRRTPKGHMLWLRTAALKALTAANSPVGIATLLLSSELLALASDRVPDSDRLLFILFTSLPLAAAGLILIGGRLLVRPMLLGGNSWAALAIALFGVFLVAAVPTFFHLTHPPHEYAVAAAWPFVLLGAFGLVLIVVILIASSTKADRRARHAKGWIGVAAIVLLILAWLDSDPASTYLPMLDWRVRSVMIFTFVFVGSIIIISLFLLILLRLVRTSFIKKLRGEAL